ncbi:arginine N-succinyltransferase [Klebsiella pneumoniae subsp. pneumoniae]|nr:arginine N-succinyltransferase [Klebsiella pneumoniae subsp. pneumoniae]
MAAFRERFNEKVVAEMRGVIDEQGYSPFWESLGKRFFAMEFSRADYLCGTGQKAFIAALMPKHPLYIDFLSPEAQAVIGKVHPQTAPARTVLEKEGFRYLNYIDIFDGGPTLECDIDRVRAIRKSHLVTTEAGETPPGDWPLCLVANEQYHPVPRSAGACRSGWRHPDPQRPRTGYAEVSCRRPGAHGAPDP